MSEFADLVRNPNPETKYRLSTTLGSTTLLLRFNADGDRDAIFEAMRQILDRASEEKGQDGPKFWMTGEIILRSPAGRVIHTMASKA